jgi:hypothetical protein
MRRYYNTEESKIRLKNYTNYYAEIPDYLTPIFQHLDTTSVMHKRKKRLYKLQKRIRNQEDMPPKNAEHRQSVLRRLNKQTLYLDEIEVDLSNNPLNLLSQNPVEDFRRGDMRIDQMFKNPEVFDIYNPEFSSDDDRMNDYKRGTEERDIQIPQKTNVSILSREFIDIELVKTDCSQIDNVLRNSADRMFEDFSELIDLKNPKFKIQKHSNKEREERSEGLDSDSQGIKNTTKKISILDMKKLKPIDNHTETKFGNCLSNRQLTTAKLQSKIDQGMFITMNSRNQKQSHLDKKEIHRKLTTSKHNTETKKSNTINWLFSSKKFSEVSLKNRESDYKPKSNVDATKRENGKKFVCNFFGSTNLDSEGWKKNRTNSNVKQTKRTASKQRQSNDHFGFGSSTLLKKETTLERSSEKMILVKRTQNKSLKDSSGFQPELERKQSDMHLSEVQQKYGLAPEINLESSDTFYKTVVTPSNSKSTRLTKNFMKKSGNYEEVKSTLKTARSEKNVLVSSVKSQKPSTNIRTIDKKFLSKISKHEKMDDEYNYFADDAAHRDQKSTNSRILKSSIQLKLADSQIGKKTLKYETMKEQANKKFSDIREKIFTKLLKKPFQEVKT